MPILNKDNFLFSCNNIEKTVVINLNNFNGNLKNYSALLVAHDEYGEIVIKTEPFKGNGESNFQKVAYPIFCLIISKENCNETKKYFSEQREALAEKAVRPSMKDTGDLKFYFSTHRKLISETILNINSHYSIISNRGAVLGLLVFNNDDPYNADIDTFYEFSEFEKELVVRKEILEKLTSYHDHLERMKSEIEAYVGDLIDSPEKKSIEKLLVKINQGILFFRKRITDKNNFLYGPILPQDALNLLIQGFEKIKTDYPTKENILNKNRDILLERKIFISQSISHLKSIQSNLKEKKEILADEYIANINETEKEISILIKELIAKEKNIASLSHTDYSSLKDEYNFFLEKISKELTSYARRADAIINKRKIQLRKEQSKLVSGNGIGEFKKILTDEVLFEFKKHSTYLEYTDLLEKLDRELADGCMSLQKVEELKKEIADLLPQLSILKNDYKTKNSQVIQARKEETTLIQQHLSEMEKNLTAVSKELYEITAHEFPIDDLNNTLRKLKLETQTLTEDKFLILNKETLNSLRTNFESFKKSYEIKTKEMSKNSRQEINDKLTRIKNQAITQKPENKEFLNKVNSVLSNEENLITSQLNPIINEFNSLRIDTFSKKLDNIIEKLDNHLKKLEGETPISLLERLINLIARTVTKEKIKIEKQGIQALDKLKEYITNPSSHNDTATMDKYCQETDSIFKNEPLMKHRSFLFFKFNPVTSEQIAKEAIELLGELKTTFKS